MLERTALPRRVRPRLAATCAVGLVVAAVTGACLGEGTPPVPTETGHVAVGATTPGPTETEARPGTATHLVLAAHCGTPRLPGLTSVAVLVNKKHPLSKRSYVPKSLKKVGSVRLRSDAAKASAKLFAAAKKSKAPLKALEGYRSYATQKAQFAHYSRKYGSAYAARISARPGYSEHQTGLALDVGTPNDRCWQSRCFAGTKQGKWVAKNAWRYGFVVRYPQGKEKITGYTYEPWHLRYVGVPLARTLHSRKIATLEQYYGRKG